MITGSLVAIVTPMLDDGSLDYPRLRSLIDWHVAEGSDGIVIVGTTGESPTVDVDEHCELIRVAVEHAAGRLPVIAGTGANSTAEAIELAKFARTVGADTQLQVVPYYNKPTQEGQYQHFKAIAEATGDLPMVLYNVPGRSVADMHHETVLRLTQVPGIGRKTAQHIFLELKYKLDAGLADMAALTGKDAAGGVRPTREKAPADSAEPAASASESSFMY